MLAKGLRHLNAIAKVALIVVLGSPHAFEFDLWAHVQL